jgi:hypothetical protein
VNEEMKKVFPLGVFKDELVLLADSLSVRRFLRREWIHNQAIIIAGFGGRQRRYPATECQGERY